MPDDSAGEKTEEATTKRKEREREQGRVARSQDIGAASVLLAAMIFLRLGGHGIYDWLSHGASRLIREDMPNLPVPEGIEVCGYAYVWMKLAIMAMAPFLAVVFLAALVVGFAQAGFTLSAQPLVPDINKINPINGFQRIFSLKGFVMLAMNMAKLALVVTIAYYGIRAVLPFLGGLAKLMPKQIFSYSAIEVVTLGLELASILFLLAVADLCYQVYQHNQDMRMTKQEVKQEMKEMEGDPQIRARRRQIQRQMAKQRMMHEVPNAEVVIRNPTHYAVAIKFEPHMSAPIVVAKGVDHLAMKIIEIAIKHGVPCWQDPPLARKLYKIELGDTIPPELFKALAEVLAHVMKNDKRAKYERDLSGSAA